MSTKYSRCLATLAISIGLSALLLTDVRAANPVNTTNNGEIVPGGTYFNTSDSKTTFTNTGGTGLWLKSGSNLRGVEVNDVGALTNNGGTIHFNAPDQIVRLDGNIDVRGIRDGSGAYLGNGGKVLVDSKYLYQNGNIYANGKNGGLAQFNVSGDVLLSGTARIETRGFGEGRNGKILINADQHVSFGPQTVLDSSGRVAGTVDENVIEINGGSINVAGIIQANGVQSNGGTIRLVAKSGDIAIQNTDGQAAALIAHGGNTRGLAVDEHGNPINRGGTIFMGSKNDIILDGSIDVRGIRDGKGAYLGNGGSVILNPGASLLQSGRIYAIGKMGGGAELVAGQDIILAGTARIEGSTSSLSAGGRIDLGPQTVLDGSFFNINGRSASLAGLIRTGNVRSSGGWMYVLATEDINIASTARLIAQGGNGRVDPQNAVRPDGLPNQPEDRAGDGGFIGLSAETIRNDGWLLANGGSAEAYPITPGAPTQNSAQGGTGGYIELRGNTIFNTGRMTVDGGNADYLNIPKAEFLGLNGGNGGLLRAYSEHFVNNGVIRAMGGAGSPPLVSIPIGTDAPPGVSGGNGGRVIVVNNTPEGTLPRFIEGNGVISVLGGPPTTPKLANNGYFGLMGHVIASGSTNKIYGELFRTLGNEVSSETDP